MYFILKGVFCNLKNPVYIQRFFHLTCNTGDFFLKMFNLCRCNKTKMSAFKNGLLLILQIA